MTSKTHAVKDGPTRVIQFQGELLAEVSSRRVKSPRWTELRLFKTDAGSYVLEKLGASVVLHAPNCPDIIGDLPRFQEQHPGADPAAEPWWFCERCGNVAVRDITSLLVESDRHWAIVAEDPAVIVDSLYRRTAGARSMPRMSLDLLDAAGAADPAILAAFSTEFVM